MTAYDYQAQKWTEGPAGTRLRLAQLREELELLTGPRGVEYARMTGAGMSRDQALVACQEGIAQCVALMVREVTP